MENRLQLASLLTIVYGVATLGRLIKTPLNNYPLLGMSNVTMECSSTLGSSSITWYFRPMGEIINVTIASGSKVYPSFTNLYWIDQPTINASNLVIRRPIGNDSTMFTCADNETQAHAQLVLIHYINATTNASDNLTVGDVIRYSCEVVYSGSLLTPTRFDLQRFPTYINIRGYDQSVIANTTVAQTGKRNSLNTVTGIFYEVASILSLSQTQCAPFLGSPAGNLPPGSARNGDDDGAATGFYLLKVLYLSFTVKPLYGPIAGGTNVTLTLENWSKLNANISAVYFDGILKAVAFQSDSTVLMTTPNSTAALIGQPLPLTVEVTPGPFNLSSRVSFTYNGPEIAAIRPSTFVFTGGQTLNVTGTRLSSVANPLIQVTIVVERGIEQNTTSERSFEPCEVNAEDDSQMTCRMPSVNIPVDFLQILDNQYNARKTRDTKSMDHLKAENSILLSRHKRYTSSLSLTLPNGNVSLDISLGIIFDGYKKYSNINDALPDTRILIYSYPEIDFTRDIVEFDAEKDEFISIKGKYMMRGCRIADYVVHVGADVCKIIDLTDNELRCRPPKQQPQSTQNGSIYCDQLPSIYIHLGFKTYQYACMKYSSRLPVLIIGLAVGLSSFVIVILLIIAIVCCCKRSRNRGSKATSNSSDRNIHVDNTTEAYEPASDQLYANQIYVRPSVQSLYVKEGYEPPSTELYVNASELKRV